MFVAEGVRQARWLRPTHEVTVDGSDALLARIGPRECERLIRQVGDKVFLSMESSAVHVMEDTSRALVRPWQGEQAGNMYTVCKE